MLEDLTCDLCLSHFQTTKGQVNLAWFLDNDNLLCPKRKPEYTEEEVNAAALKFFEASATEAKKEEAKNEPPPTLSPPTSNPAPPSPTHSLSAPPPNSNPDSQPLPDQFQCHSCKCWHDMPSVGFPFDKAQDTLFMDGWCAPFDDFYCDACKATGKAVILPHYSSPTSEGQNDFVDSDLVIMQSTNLMTLLKSKSNGQLDASHLTLGGYMQKIMAIRRSTAAAYALATINPQPLSPTSSPFPSTAHNSKLVSSPHSNIIPMAQKQISPVLKMGKRKQRTKGGAKLSRLGSMP